MVECRMLRKVDSRVAEEGPTATTRGVEAVRATCTVVKCPDDKGVFEEGEDEGVLDVVEI